MKSPLPRLGLTVLLASSFTAHADIDQVPYYVAGLVVNELAKGIGKDIAQNQMALNKTKPTTSVLQQDLKFIFAEALKEGISAGLPALAQESSNARAGLAAIAENAAQDLDRTLTPMPSTQALPRPQLSAADLSAAARQGDAVLNTPNKLSAAAYKAGAKYVAVSEAWEYLDKIGEAWHKAIHKSSPSNVQRIANNQTVTIPSVDQNAYYEESPFTPLYWFRWLGKKAKDTTLSCRDTVVEIWDNKALAVYVSVHLAVAYMVTRATMFTSRRFREMNFVNRGYALFKNEPFKQVFETTMGVFMSLYIKPYVTMPLLSQIAEQSGMNTTQAAPVAEAAYMAGIKTPFAVDALIETQAAGFVPVAMLGSLFVMDRFMPWVRKLITGAVFTVEFAFAYYRAKQANHNPQHAHAH